MINERKGFVATGVTLAFACFACLALIGSLYSINNARAQVQHHIQIVQDYYLQEAALDRIYAALEDNISYSTFHAFDADTENFDIEMQELAQETQSVDVNGEWQSDDQVEVFTLTFDVYSAVDVAIDVAGDKPYKITLISPSGEQVFSESASGTYTSCLMANDIYDVVANIRGYGYGIYTLEVTLDPNSLVQAGVYFNQVTARTVKVKCSRGVERHFLVESETTKNSVSIVDPGFI